MAFLRRNYTIVSPRRRGSLAGPICRLSSMFALLALLVLTAIPGRAAETPTAKEPLIKAAFLYNFTQLATWPPARFVDERSPIVVGVLGQSAVAEELGKGLKDRTFPGREVVIKTIGSLDEARGVHLLFVSRSAESDYQKMETAVQELAILTVGESPEFAAQGGIITFVLKGDKIRFEINLGAADHAGIRLNSQLLKLATAIRKASAT